MKLIIIASQVFLISILCSCTDSSAKNSASTNMSKGFAVVELFTSEGCSSCPPADNSVAKLLKEHNDDVYVLSYHVDYWDNLGWKDVFSSAAYTQVQRDYAKKFKLSSVYTPQIVVNGTEQFVGSDENKLWAAVDRNLQQSSITKLDIDAKAMSNGVMVNYSTDAVNGKLKVALVQLSAEDKIQRGENSGATLHHVNIVRDLQTVPASSNGKIMLNIPARLDVKDCRVIAFTQSDNGGKITAAMEVNIQ
jgi:hypothetical protein